MLCMITKGCHLRLPFRNERHASPNAFEKKLLRQGLGVNFWVCGDVRVVCGNWVQNQPKPAESEKQKSNVF